jgi:spermidine/putrescine transport system substrate-binding protein
VASRRDVLRALAVGAGALALGPLASCTGKRPVSLPGSGSVPPPTTPIPDPETFWAQQDVAGTLDFANWPYYIDRTRTGDHPSLDLFTKRTGIDVTYFRTNRGNERFLEKIRPGLEAGTPEYDLIVVTNGPELTELMQRGWLTPLDHSRLPNFETNASALVTGPAWDPQNLYTVAWQSGFTGLGYRPEAVHALGREPKSVHDLWDPALKGKVGMMTDLIDLGSTGLLATGVDPATSTVDDWNRAAQLLRTQHDAVSPRYYDQGYIDALGRGDTWLTLAWSGDVFQLQHLGHPEVRWIMPDEGAMFWTDNMMIPAGAQHPADAIEYMNYVYRPEIAAMIADWVWYVSPVPAARSVVAGRLHDPVVAGSQLVFPPNGSAQQASGPLDGPILDYYVFPDLDQYSIWRSLFEPVIYAG